jgi:predicted dithiol-disulfide oxidoreductase (DUF899 family)
MLGIAPDKSAEYTWRMTETPGPRETPRITDRQTWQAALNDLRVREKAHTRAGDALAAERRRLPMIEVDASTPLIGAGGETTLWHAFEGRTQLIAYFHMWHAGHTTAGQCEGCTFSTSHMTELSYLHSRDVTYATFCEGGYDLRDGERVFETYWTTGRGNEVMAPSYGLLDRTVYGRQEHWEDSPAGWPKHWGTRGDQMRQDGRPTAQWSRVHAGRDEVP